ncbi:hypothetical protein BX666DRAFT_1853391 [Dichotomocladium elegans]|nr:hypothetical protein BX666DRAFT_1853391 [Dichotomocladium elegans]
MANRLEQVRSNMMGSDSLEEKVEVNQRHLIDKILARYSAEYVLYRELMQNADDASSTSVKIQFHSESPGDPAKPNLSGKCNKITFRNNGIPFRPEDWARLKRIAEGNPGKFEHEQKIGAFGVGFYSLFSVCENPFVASGSQCMAFYFKGDQLFARRGDVPEKDRDEWTSFLMELREPMEMPALDDFSKFLSTSMGFTANLREVIVSLDSHMIFKINKETRQPRAMTVDSKRVQTISPNGMFTITGANMREIQLSAEKYTPPSFMSSFLSKRPVETNGAGLPVEKANIFLRVVTGSLAVRVSPAFEREMERATKKKPPKTTTFQIVYTGRQELDASENNSDIFKDLVPFPNQGRVFIGFPTHQTTGCCSHMAARFIPTVERENIDFADRYISVWNTELLSIGGLLCRIIYNYEMDQVDRLYGELIGRPEFVDKTDGSINEAKIMFEKQAAHALFSFTFKPSTPSNIVQQVQQEHFFSGNEYPFLIMTSHGIRPVNGARTLPDPTDPQYALLSEFIKSVPTITPLVQDNAKDGVDKLRRVGLLKMLDFQDVIKELDIRTLRPTEMVACMKWWIENMRSGTIANVPDIRRRFLDAALLQQDDENTIPLSSIKYWINPKITPPKMPMPGTALPFDISRSFNPRDLGAYFGSWVELSLADWVRFIAERKELETDASFAELALRVITHGYSHVSSKAQADIAKVLKAKRCIPTKFGLRFPHEAYFETVKLFDDLPIIHFEKPISEHLLSSLGVRKHVELQLVFDRLLSDGSWSHVDLVKYLTSIQATLSQTEVNRLKETPIFTKEGEEPKLKELQRKTGATDSGGNAVMEKYTKRIFRRYKACDLYAPLDVLRKLHLPIIDWTQARWRSDAPEAKFMERLGLVTTPSVTTILTLASAETPDKDVQNRALHYFLENHKRYEDVYLAESTNIAFLPCSDGKTYATPRSCFTNPEAQILGFQVLHQDLSIVRDKLGVRENPDGRQLLEGFIQSITTDQAKAQRIFEYMADRMGDIGSMQWSRLRETKFVPVAGLGSENMAGADSISLVEPGQCYFNSGESTFHKELFLYVDFGQRANSFLRSCGVKDEPNTTELAFMIVRDPQRFRDLSGGGERYLNVLRQIAGQYRQLRTNRKLLEAMKTTPFLIGIQRSPVSSESNVEQTLHEEEGQEDFVQYRLARAQDIFIADDTMAQQIFSPLCAPMEPLLEDFYVHLGSNRLSQQITETYRYRELMGVTDRTKAVTDLVFERVPIIIYQMMSDNPQRQKELCHDERYVKRNLKIVQARELKIHRKFKYAHKENVQPTLACADRKSYTIYISSMGEIDYYDIANALCGLLFTRVRFNDAIVVERYLTANLNSLRRKGVPVDRILNIRKTADKQPTIVDMSPSAVDPLPSAPTLTPAQLDECTKKVLQVFSDCQEGYVRQLLSRERENHVERVIETLLQNKDYPRNQVTKEEDAKRTATMPTPVQPVRPTSMFDRFFNPWKGMQQQQQQQQQQEDTQPTEPPVKVIDKKPKLPSSDTTITPNYTSNIKQNLRRAIHSCKPFSGQDVFSPPQINKVRESNNYCDARPQHDLVSAGKIKELEFYVHRTVDPVDVHQQYGAAMGRFANIIKSLAAVFELKATTLHIFYDTQGQTIAFNMNGSLFMNLRYYLALHEPDTPAKAFAKQKEALIYWFMTICHELAHNFVADHSSEHEFYMSSFAEVYLEPFMDSLSIMMNHPPSAAATPFKN